MLWTLVLLLAVIVCTLLALAASSIESHFFSYVYEMAPARIISMDVFVDRYACAHYSIVLEFLETAKIEKIDVVPSTYYRFIKGQSVLVELLVSRYFRQEGFGRISALK